MEDLLFPDLLFPAASSGKSPSEPRTPDSGRLLVKVEEHFQQHLKKHFSEFPES